MTSQKNTEHLIRGYILRKKVPVPVKKVHKLTCWACTYSTVDTVDTNCCYGWHFEKNWSVPSCMDYVLHQIFEFYIYSFYQCCGSGMIYSRSGYSLRIFRVPDPGKSFGIQLILWSIFGNYKKHTLNSIKKKNLPVPNICHFLFHTTVHWVQSYSTHSPEFAGLKWEIKFLFICSFIFAGSRTIIPDPDPGKSSGSKVFRIRNTAFYRHLQSTVPVPVYSSVYRIL